MKKYIILLACSLIVISSAKAGGPWPQKKGKAYIKLSEWWVVFKQHYDSNGEIQPNATTGIFNTTLYAEYGFTDRLTGIVYAPLLSRNYMNRGGTKEAINTFGDMDLGIKYGLTKPGSKIPVSATLFLGIPTGKSSAGTFGSLQTGDGEFNQMLQIDTGTSFQLGKKKKVNSYVSAYIGFNNRTKDFSEEFRYGVEYGVGFFNNKLWLAAKLNAVESFKNGTAVERDNPSLFSNNAEYISYSLDVAYYATKKVGFSLGYGAAFRAENIAAAPIFSVGVFVDLSK